MKTRGTRTGRNAIRGLARTSCLLLLAGLSCKYNVTLPWVSEDAGARVPDSAFDQAPPPPPDVAIASPDSAPDSRVCSGKQGRTSGAYQIPVQIIAAIDRSTPMLSVQRDFDPANRAQVAFSALSTSVEHHPGISLWPIWFPWNSCGGAMCCASPPPFGSFVRPDASSGCAPYEASCTSSSNESPSHLALKQASTSLRSWGTWYSTIVLVTDQNPSCAGDSPSDSSACDSAANYINELAGKGIRTYVVIPNADGHSPDCLTRTKPNTRETPESQKVVTTSKEMRSHIESIVAESAKKLCRMIVPDLDPWQVDQIKIGNNPPIQRDDSGKTGWKLSEGTILLSTEECNKVNSTPTPEVTAYSCSSGGGSGYGGP